MESLVHVPDVVENFDEFIFQNNEADSASAIPDAKAWAEQAFDALNELRESVDEALSLLDEDLLNLHVLSTEEIVNRVIQKVVNKECNLEDLQTFEVIQREQAELVNSIDLPSMRLREFAGDNPEIIKNHRSALPTVNALKAPAFPSGSALEKTIVSVQVYKNMFTRETKVLEIEMLLSHTVHDLFNVIVDNQPETKMFDGPSYGGSGMILIGDRMYNTGPEDYSAPYHTWTSRYQIPHSVHDMDGVRLGDLPNMPSLVTSTTCCFVIFCGNEMRRIFFSGISIKHAEDNFPRITYRRRGVRLQRCCLCTTRTADLIILNDVILPKNPSYSCTSCYRRLRAGASGEFILPSSDVICEMQIFMGAIPLLVLTDITLVIGLHKEVCRFSPDDKDVITFYHDEYHKTFTMEWNYPDISHVIARGPAQGMVPNCENISAIASSTPNYFDWARDEVIDFLGVPSPLGQCPSFPMILKQDSSNLTIDCFLLNRGDARITWVTPSVDDSRCFAGVDMSRITEICDSLTGFMMRVIDSSNKPKGRRSNRSSRISIPPPQESKRVPSPPPMESSPMPNSILPTPPPLASLVVGQQAMIPNPPPLPQGLFTGIPVPPPLLPNPVLTVKKSQTSKHSNAAAMALQPVQETTQAPRDMKAPSRRIWKQPPPVPSDLPPTMQEVLDKVLGDRRDFLRDSDTEDEEDDFDVY